MLLDIGRRKSLYRITERIMCLISRHTLHIKKLLSSSQKEQCAHFLIIAASLLVLLKSHHAKERKKERTRKKSPCSFQLGVAI